MLWLLPPDAPSWHATDPAALSMPYWAFAWPGGQVLARYVLDHPALVSGKRVLDFASGCAVEGVAAAVAGAQVCCADLDPLAAKYAVLNARQNGVTLTTSTDDLIGRDVDVDVILAGDACYEPELAARVIPWLRAQAQRGVKVLIGDPLRVPGALDAASRLVSYPASFDGDPRGLTLWPTHVLRLP
jgi:predicted nicotinamide N-methyase